MPPRSVYHRRMRCQMLTLVASMLALIGVASPAGLAARDSAGTPAARSAFDAGERGGESRKAGRSRRRVPQGHCGGCGIHRRTPAADRGHPASAAAGPAVRTPASPEDAVRAVGPATSGARRLSGGARAAHEGRRSGRRVLQQGARARSAVCQSAFPARQKRRQPRRLGRPAGAPEGGGREQSRRAALLDGVRHRPSEKRSRPLSRACAGGGGADSPRARWRQRRSTT